VLLAPSARSGNDIELEMAIIASQMTRMEELARLEEEEAEQPEQPDDQQPNEDSDS